MALTHHFAKAFSSFKHHPMALTNSLRFTNSSGTYTDPNVGGSQKYYRLTTP